MPNTYEGTFSVNGIRMKELFLLMVLELQKESLLMIKQVLKN